MMGRHRRRRRNSQGFVPKEYQPDFPVWMYWIFAAIVGTPVLVALILQVTER